MSNLAGPGIKHLDVEKYAAGRQAEVPCPASPCPTLIARILASGAQWLKCSAIPYQRPNNNCFGAAFSTSRCCGRARGSFWADSRTKAFEKVPYLLLPSYLQKHQSGCIESSSMHVCQIYINSTSALGVCCLIVGGQMHTIDTGPQNGDPTFRKITTIPWKIIQTIRIRFVLFLHAAQA